MINQCPTETDTQYRILLALTKTSQNHESIKGAIIQNVKFWIYPKKQRLFIETQMLEYEFKIQLL